MNQNWTLAWDDYKDLKIDDIKVKDILENLSKFMERIDRNKPQYALSKYIYDVFNDMVDGKPDQIPPLISPYRILLHSRFVFELQDSIFKSLFEILAYLCLVGRLSDERLKDLVKVLSTYSLSENAPYNRLIELSKTITSTKIDSEEVKWNETFEKFKDELSFFSRSTFLDLQAQIGNLLLTATDQLNARVIENTSNLKITEQFVQLTQAFRKLIGEKEMDSKRTFNILLFFAASLILVPLLTLTLGLGQVTQSIETKTDSELAQIKVTKTAQNDEKGSPKSKNVDAASSSATEGQKANISSSSGSLVAQPIKKNEFKERLPETYSYLSYLIRLLPVFAIEFLLLYFFRLTYTEYRSINAQITQLEMRNALCQFIQAYQDFVEQQGKETDKTGLEKFATLVFSGLAIDPASVPTAFDGIEQLSKLFESARKK